MMQQVLKTGLEIYGFEVVMASDGLEALQLYHAEKGRFAAILTDNEMPRMNGKELVRALRKGGYGGRIVVMSGNLKEADLDAYRPFNISGFFSKPFDVATLAHLLL
jgi:CheY-like chemotaxis protein